jgi:putative DNA primase/helicase
MALWKAALCCDIRPTTLEWLWPQHLARGKLAILDGDPDMGKSLLAIDLIARLSRGLPMPNGSSAPGPCTSIMLSAEDNAADTIRPRAEAAGADLSRFVLPDFGGQAPRFPDDIAALEELIVERGADLVVIDPVMAFLPPKVAAHLDQLVRLALTPLAAMAAWTGCAVVLVRHLTKHGRDRAVLRGQGSMGIMAAVRTGLFVAPHPADETARVLAVAKTNVGRRPPALGYRVVESATGQPVIEWTGPADLTADGLCARKSAAGLKARDRAADWLKRELARGPRKAADLYAAAAEAGIPERTLFRAKAAVNVLSHRAYDHEEERGEWYWYDPDAEWPKDAPFKKPFEIPPLPEM